MKGTEGPIPAYRRQGLAKTAAKREHGRTNAFSLSVAITIPFARGDFITPMTQGRVCTLGVGSLGDEAKRHENGDAARNAIGRISESEEKDGKKEHTRKQSLPLLLRPRMLPPVHLSTSVRQKSFSRGNLPPAIQPFGGDRMGRCPSPQIMSVPVPAFPSSQPFGIQEGSHCAGEMIGKKLQRPPKRLPLPYFFATSDWTRSQSVVSSSPFFRCFLHVFTFYAVLLFNRRPIVAAGPNCTSTGTNIVETL